MGQAGGQQAQGASHHHWQAHSRDSEDGEGQGDQDEKREAGLGREVLTLIT